MMKRITSLLTALALFLCLSLTVFAQELPFVADHAGLLFPDEITALEEKAAELSQSYGIQPVILTVDSLEGRRAQDYADDYYDQTGYGDDGVLFLLAMAEREWYISTCGSVIYALTDYGIQQIGENVVYYLGEGLWYEGFACFLDSLNVYLDAYENGTVHDGYADHSGDYYHGDREETVYYGEEYEPSFLLSLMCGMIVAALVVFSMRRSMNTKRARRAAGEYLVEGSWALTQHSDIFLYSNVTKTRKQEPRTSSGGGSSVHRSSGGRRHGGGGGRF